MLRANNHWGEFFMPSKITFFPVGNGDMTLIKLDDKANTAILIDINIRQSSDGEEDRTQCDVAAELRKRLLDDENNRPYVDTFILTHPDQDHCRGLQEHFHLGSLDDYVDEPDEDTDKKIVIREIWSSPMIFRRASKNNTLCNDAKEFNKEARRRVNLFKEKGKGKEGDRIVIIGEDENGKTNDLQKILLKIDQETDKINDKPNTLLKALMLGPLPPQEDEDKEEKLASNRSSIILRLSIKAKENDTEPSCLFMLGGDAGVYIWERLWDKHKNDSSKLEYDVLLTPHHCSWHSLSYDSWKDCKDPKINNNARSALAQANSDATLISSSNPIKDDKNDPPCWGAKKEYEKIANNAGSHGKFLCLEEYPDEKEPEPYEIEIHQEGHKRPGKKALASAAIISRSAGEKLGHG